MRYGFAIASFAGIYGCGKGKEGSKSAVPVDKGSPKNHNLIPDGMRNHSEKGENELEVISRFNKQVYGCQRDTVAVEGKCFPTGPLELADGRSVTVGNKIDESESDYTFAIDSHPLVLKLLRTGIKDNCRERAAFEVLDGLDGFVPKRFEITGGLSDGCKQRVMVLERKGSSSWTTVVKKFDKSFNLRFAKLIEAVRELHNRGFVHMVIRRPSVLVDSGNPDTVALIGLHEMRPFGENYSRKDDMQRLALMVEIIDGPKPPWFKQFENEMFALGEKERPDYEKWIAFFRSQ